MYLDESKYFLSKIIVMITEKTLLNKYLEGENKEKN